MSAETQSRPGLELSKNQARRFLLAHQGLWPPHGLRGKAGLLAFIRWVGCIQFDPLDIVGQNPELVLQSRLADFQPAILEEMLYQERSLLDGWDKNMSISTCGSWISPRWRRYRTPTIPRRKLPSWLRWTICSGNGA